MTGQPPKAKPEALRGRFWVAMLTAGSGVAFIMTDTSPEFGAICVGGVAVAYGFGMMRAASKLLLACGLLAATMAAQVPITILSTSHSGTASWVTVPVPWLEAQAMPEEAVLEMDGRQWRAVRGRRVGYQTVFYDALIGILRQNTRTEAELVEPPAGWPNQPPFTNHAWVSDDLTRLVPSFRLTMAGGAVHQSAPLQPVLDFESPARQDWSITTRCGPLVLHWWATQWHQQAVVEWQLLVVHSNPASAAVQITPERLQITLGEPFVIDDALPLGVPAPRYDSQQDAWSADLVSSAVDLGDGQGLPVFRGAILATDSTKPWYYHLLTPVASIRGQVNRLLARGGGQPLGGTDWTGRWLAFQATIPRGTADDAEIAGRLENQQAFMRQPQDLYAPRLLGLNPSAGSTGAQEDFGASRGAELYLGGELLFGTTWGYHQQASMRPMHYRELDGSSVVQANHPNWWTWSQLTHWHCSVSSDRLGKPCPVPAHNTHGFTGKDDQHVSSNGLFAAVAAFDWPAYRQLISDEIDVAMANVRLLPPQQPGAPRAVGRRMLADSNRWILTGREDVWETLVVGFGEMAHRMSFAPLPDFRLQGPPITDARVLVDAAGEPVPAIVVWQEGLTIGGLAAGWAAHRYRRFVGLPELPDTQAIGDQLVGIGTTLVRHYFAEGNDGWQFFLNVAWDGSPPDPAVIGAPGDIVGVARDLHGLDSGWFDWIGPGLYYLRRGDHGLDVPIDVQQRLQSMFNEWEAEVAPTANIARREWFAVVDANAPAPPPINVPPEVTIVGPLELTAGTTQDYTAVVTDPDGDPITLSWDSLDQAGELVTIHAAEPGTVTLTVTVSDGRASSTTSITIVVK